MPSHVTGSAMSLSGLLFHLCGGDAGINCCFGVDFRHILGGPGGEGVQAKGVDGYRNSMPKSDLGDGGLREVEFLRGEGRRSFKEISGKAVVLKVRDPVLGVGR